MVFIAVEAVSAGSKPPGAVSVRVSTGERHDFGAAVPLSTRASSLQQGRAIGSVESSLDLLQHTPYACESCGLVLRLPPLRDVATEHHAQGLLNADLSLSSS